MSMLLLRTLRVRAWRLLVGDEGGDEPNVVGASLPEARSAVDDVEGGASGGGVTSATSLPK